MRTSRVEDAFFLEKERRFGMRSPEAIEPYEGCLICPGLLALPSQGIVNLEVALQLVELTFVPAGAVCSSYHPPGSKLRLLFLREVKVFHLRRWF